MATPIQLADRRTNSVANIAELIYTSPATGSGVIIDSFTAANNSTANASYKAYIVPLGELVENPLKPSKVVVWGEIDLGAGVSGQLIPKSARLYTEQSVAGAIHFTISGREV